MLPETDLRQGSCASNLLRKYFWGYWGMLEDFRGARSKVSVAVSGKVLQEAASAHPEGSCASGTRGRDQMHIPFWFQTTLLRYDDR